MKANYLAAFSDSFLNSAEINRIIILPVNDENSDKKYIQI